MQRLEKITGGSAGEPPAGNSLWPKKPLSPEQAELAKLIPLANCNGQVANLQYLLNFQSWRSAHDKYSLVTADLKNGTSQLTYHPAASVLHAIDAMCAVAAKDGPLRFKNPKRFTKNGRLVTSLFEISRKVRDCTGKELSDRVIQRALLLLHNDGLIYKTKGRYGHTRQCRLFIDLKGYRLYRKLDAAIYSCLPHHSSVRKRFPLAEEGEYGFDRQFAPPYTPDQAAYINCNNVPGAIDRDEKSPITIQNNIPDDITPIPNEENVPPGRPLFNFEEKEDQKISEGDPVGNEPWVEFNLTPQVQKILEFIQSHDVFADETGECRSVERITAQEVSTLINAVQTMGLTLSFLKRYARFVEGGDAWFLKTRLGFFCDHFFIIKKMFYQFEAGEQLSRLFLPPGGIIIDLDADAHWFIKTATFALHFESDSVDYRKYMAFDPRINDGGRESACTVLRALTLSNITPEDRDFIIAEHAPLASQWFLKTPTVYFGLKNRGYPIDRALKIQDEQPLRDELEKQYMDVKSYSDRYTGQLYAATADLVRIDKYQDPE